MIEPVNELVALLARAAPDKLAQLRADNPAHAEGILRPGYPAGHKSGPKEAGAPPSERELRVGIALAGLQVGIPKCNEAIAKAKARVKTLDGYQFLGEFVALLSAGSVAKEVGKIDLGWGAILLPAVAAVGAVIALVTRHFAKPPGASKSWIDLTNELVEKRVEAHAISVELGTWLKLKEQGVVDPALEGGRVGKGNSLAAEILRLCLDVGVLEAGDLPDPPAPRPPPGKAKRPPNETDKEKGRTKEKQKKEDKPRAEEI